MSILEILEAHQAYRTYIDRDDMAKVSCSCGDKDIKRAGMLADGSHRAHVAQVLEQHEREANAEALEEAADEIEAKAERLSPDDSFQQGARIGIITSAVDLQTRAAQLRATP